MIRILLICLFSLLSSPGLLFAREVVFYHTDNVGSPVAMTNSDGAVVWRAHDKPFGEEFQTTATPEHSSRRFIGKEKDKETGLVYIGARYLDPVTGRFLQPDPVGPVDPMTGKVNAAMLSNPQRLNRYAYGLNNPYWYIDPDGRETVVLVGRATSGNPFGHVAIGFTGQGVYSYGTGNKPGSSLTGYLDQQAAYRDTTVYTLNTTPEQENKMRAEIMKYDKKPLPDPRTNLKGAWNDNCATRTQNALGAGGVSSMLVPLTSPFPTDTGVIARRNSTSSMDVKKGDTPPKGLSTFNRDR